LDIKVASVFKPSLRTKKRNVANKENGPAGMAITDNCRVVLEKLGCNAEVLLNKIGEICASYGLPRKIGTFLIEGTQVDAARIFHIDQRRAACLRSALEKN
jgi:hypothetical protein